MVRQGIYDKFMNGPDHVIELFHGYTYTGHPMAAAAVLPPWTSTATRTSSRTPRSSRTCGPMPPSRCRATRWSRTSARIGLVAAIDLKPIEGSPGLRAYKAMENGFHDVGMMVRITADTIALSPPLMINENQIDEIFTDKMPKILASVA